MAREKKIEARKMRHMRIIKKGEPEVCTIVPDK